jgi:hypothetical protein
MALRWPPKATSSVFTLPLALAQPGYHTVLPVCLNLLPELKALGWVPPSASADAAFLHMRCRLPSDARLAYEKPSGRATAFGSTAPRRPLGRLGHPRGRARLGRAARREAPRGEP